MKKLLTSMLILAMMITTNMVHAAGTYFEEASFTDSEKETIKSREKDAKLDKTIGDVHMLKSVSNDFIILTFSENGGFSKDTYQSILTGIKIAVGSEYASFFEGEYKETDIGTDKSFTNFIVVKNPTRTAHEIASFGANGTNDILRVEICIKASDVTPSPSPTPTPSNTPTPTPTPSDEPEVPTSTPTTEVENPSTGDMNLITIGAVVIVAILGIGLSIKKIHE